MSHPSSVSVSPDVMSGAPVFKGTRVTLRTLIDYLEGGASLDDFLSDFPTVTREQAVAALEFAEEAIVAGLDEAASR